jgi:hypothetical protein
VPAPSAAGAAAQSTSDEESDEEALFSIHNVNRSAAASAYRDIRGQDSDSDDSD